MVEEVLGRRGDVYTASLKSNTGHVTGSTRYHSLLTSFVKYRMPLSTEAYWTSSSLRSTKISFHYTQGRVILTKNSCEMYRCLCTCWVEYAVSYWIFVYITVSRTGVCLAVSVRTRWTWWWSYGEHLPQTYFFLTFWCQFQASCVLPFVFWSVFVLTSWDEKLRHSGARSVSTSGPMSCPAPL